MILKGELGKSVRDVIRRLSEWRKIEILEGKVQVDHLSLLLPIPAAPNLHLFNGSIAIISIKCITEIQTIVQFNV
jgi:REP element-mobilizing transposase RayT